MDKQEILLDKKDLLSGFTKEISASDQIVTGQQNILLPDDKRDFLMDIES